MLIETKYAGGKVKEVKEIVRNGITLGEVSGYIATFDVDRGDYFGTKDQFLPGAFLESLAEHRARNNRQIRLKDHHGMTVGGFPIETAMEDGRGLFAKGEINLDVQRGREVFSLAKQGVLVDFSIGFSPEKSMKNEEGDLRTISQATIWEGSVVDEPMNINANITEVKALNAISDFDDLPLAAKTSPWNAKAAERRIQDEFVDNPASLSLSKFYLFTDTDTPGEASYKLLFADIIDGRPVAIPQAILDVAQELKTKQGVVESWSESARQKAIKHIEKYLAKMGEPSPFSILDRQYFSADSVKAFTERDLEYIFKRSGLFSRTAAKMLAGRLKEGAPEVFGNDVFGDAAKALSMLVEMKNSFSSRPQ